MAAARLPYVMDALPGGHNGRVDLTPACVDFSPVYEMLLSLFVFSRGRDRSVYDAGDSHFAEVRRRASRAVLTTLGQLPDGGWIWPHLLGLAVECRARTIAELVCRLQAIGDQELVLTASGFYDRRFSKQLRKTIRRGMDGDLAAREAAVTALTRSEEQRRMARFVLETPPATLCSQLTWLLAAWQEEVFRPSGNPACKELEEEARAKQSVSWTSPEKLVQLVTGAQYRPPFGRHRLMVTPSAILSPVILSLLHKDWVIVCYPFEPKAGEGGEALVRALRRTHRALEDETRLRILRMLAKRSKRREELARQLQLSCDALDPHMVLLRSAGLVGLTNVGGRITYSFRRRAVFDSASQLHRYLYLGQ